MEPRQVGKYRIVAKIGQGAMGEVFRAHDPILDRDVASKSVSEKLSADEPIPGSRSSGGAPAGPLTRTKVCPKEVSTIRSEEGTGQAAERSA